jgi:hypothetical protein
MSWSSSVTNVNGSELEAALLAEPVMAPEFGHAESLAAAQDAKDATVALFKTGALGSPDQFYSVYLSGHANPDHVKPPQWSADCVTITIRQEQPRVTQPEEASS